jgi:NADH dehydrogenase
MQKEMICLLGGTGFVGRHLATRLTHAGYRVHILTRRRERHRALLVNPDICLIQADVHDIASLKSHFSGAAAVINLVGILNETAGKKDGFYKVHAELAEKTAQAVVSCGVRRLLHMSALNADINEQHSQYLKTRGEGEFLAHKAGDHGVRVTSFRPSVIFGPGDSFFNRFATLLKISPVFFPLACPGSRFAPVYVDDVTEAFCRALDGEATPGQQLDLCGPTTYTLKELVEYTRDTLGLRKPVLGLSDGLSRLQARVLGMVPGKPFSLDNYYSLQHDSICEHNALPGLGIVPTSVDAVVPYYLAAGSTRGRYDSYRQAARRK